MLDQRHYARVGLVIAAMFLLAGCAGALIGGAATTGVAVAQERTVGSAVDDAGTATKPGGINTVYYTSRLSARREGVYVEFGNSPRRRKVSAP